MPDEQQIRDRAYRLWEEDGRPDGHDEEHWHRARRQLEGADANPEAAPDSIGLASGLQPGGTLPGGSPAAGMGSIGTGGGSTDNRATGAAARER